MAFPSFLKGVFKSKNTDEIVIPAAKQKARNAEGFYRMTCPYCLEQFDVWEMPFRAQSISAVAASPSVSADAGRKRHSGYGQSVERAATPTQPDADSLRYFPVEEDKKLKQFTEHVKAKGRSYVLGKVLTLYEPDSEGGAFNGQGIQAVKLRDQKEWIPITLNAPDLLYHKAIVRVRDIYNNESAVRLCPHCHNVMSNDVCLYPNYTIMFMGNTNCGKTVYKIRLLYEMSKEGLLNRHYSLNRISTGNKVDGLEVTSIDDLYEQTFGSAHRGESEGIAPITQIQYIDPITFPLLQNGQTSALITFYDFPGEAIWKRRDDPEYGWFLAQIEKRINELDGIIFLLDTSTVNNIRNALPENFIFSQKGTKEEQSRKTPAQVLGQFQQNFITAEMENIIPLPICYTFSKCDLLAKVIRDVRNDGSIAPGLAHVVSDLMEPPVCVTNWEEQGLHELRQSKCANETFDPTHWEWERNAYIRNRQARHTRVDMENILRSHEELQSLFSHETGAVMSVSPKGLLFALSAVGVPIKKDEAIPEVPPIRLTEPLEYLMWQMGLAEHDAETLVSDDDKRTLCRLRTGRQ